MMKQFKLNYLRLLLSKIFDIREINAVLQTALKNFIMLPYIRMSTNGFDSNFV